MLCPKEPQVFREQTGILATKVFLDSVMEGSGCHPLARAWVSMECTRRSTVQAGLTTNTLFKAPLLLVQ